MGDYWSEILQGTLDLMVLKTVDAMGPMHGYGIALRIEQVAQDALNRPTTSANGRRKAAPSPTWPATTPRPSRTTCGSPARAAPNGSVACRRSTASSTRLGGTPTFE